MSMGAFKANTFDRYLRPIREQVKQLITRGATLVEFGCGNGDLLFKLSDSIGLGWWFNRFLEVRIHSGLRLTSASISVGMLW